MHVDPCTIYLTLWHCFRYYCRVTDMSLSICTVMSLQALASLTLVHHDMFCIANALIHPPMLHVLTTGRLLNQLLSQHISHFFRMTSRGSFPRIQMPFLLVHCTNILRTLCFGGTRQPTICSRAGRGNSMADVGIDIHGVFLQG